MTVHRDVAHPAQMSWQALFGWSPVEYDQNSGMREAAKLSSDLGSQEPKALGAYYTDAQIADFLVCWAIRTPADRVLDPSFGGGVFLRSACKRLRHLRGNPRASVFGVEIDPAVHRCISEKLKDEFDIDPDHLRLSDFFALPAVSFTGVTAVVGNPPFIRYQRFTGDVRARALARCLETGVVLSELTSSWVPFILHSSAMLADGGRLAMVVPAEIGHARYAEPMLEYLRRSFKAVTFLTFQKRLFPHLNEDTLLLLAEGKGSHRAKFQWKDFDHAGVLKDVPLSDASIPGTRQLNASRLIAGDERLVEQFIPKRARELYAELKQGNLAKPLGDLADVGIGYVTGANEFFHVGEETIRAYDIPRRFLKKAVRRGRSLAGLRYTDQDWGRTDASYLLHIEERTAVPSGVERYLQVGVTKGVTKGFKCRTRTPWFKVPHVYQPDAFLSYMSGYTPRLVSNDADAVAPNSLHIVRMHDETTLDRDSLTALWQTSLTRLSAEIEGHPLGGGMLKLEPTEAERVLVPNVRHTRGAFDDLAIELDGSLRAGSETEAQQRADDVILRRHLGLSSADCRLLAESAERLRDRRTGKGIN